MARETPKTREDIMRLIDHHLTGRFLGQLSDWDKDAHGNVDHPVPVDIVIDSMTDLVCSLLGIAAEDEIASPTPSTDKGVADVDGTAAPVDDIVADLGDFADRIDRNGFVNALGGHAKTLRAAVAALLERRAPSPWHWSDATRPEEGRRIVALYEDGSGATIGYWTGEEILDHDGDESAWRDKPGAVWAYLPEGYELWCENRIDDPFTFPATPPR